MKTHVVKTTPGATIGEAVDLMDLYQVNGLPVVDSAGKLCGYLAEVDILRIVGFPGNVADGGGIPLPQRDLPVEQVMCKTVISISEHTSLASACSLLLDHHLKRLPVTDAMGRVVGTLNRIDVVQALLEGTVSVVPSDEPPHDLHDL